MVITSEVLEHTYADSKFFEMQFGVRIQHADGFCLKSLFQSLKNRNLEVQFKTEILTAKLTLTFQRPYIVYMLQDLDILEDWTTIRKVCLKSNGIQVYFLQSTF